MPCTVFGFYFALFTSHFAMRINHLTNDDEECSPCVVIADAQNRLFAYFGGRSELNMSYSTFHSPSACFFHTVRYFPL